MTDDSAAVRCTQLGRVFKPRGNRSDDATVHAVASLDLEITEGEFFGLLGPNGAGKTTTIKMLTTLLIPSSGRAAVLGMDVVDRARDVRWIVGAVFGGERGLYDRLSGRDNLRLFGELYGISGRAQADRIDTMVEAVGLSSAIGKRVETYSNGMRQRLHLARGLLHRPRVLFLDEPTVGLDPVGAHQIREIVAELRDSGTTIILTTHNMAEADELCDRVGVIKEGRLIAQGSTAQLKANAGDADVIEYEVLGVTDETIERIRRLSAVTACVLEDMGKIQVLRVSYQSGATVTGAVTDLVRQQMVGDINRRSATLEDAYISLVS